MQMSIIETEAQRNVLNDEKTWDKLNKFIPLKDAIELMRIRAFPAEDQEKEEEYLWDPFKFDIDSHGCIYVTDNKAHSIFKFDPRGKLILKFGRKGQGPGEFSSPIGIRICKDTVLINDSGNRRFQYFNLDGKLLRTSPVFKTYESYYIIEEGLVIAKPFLTNIENKKFIEKLSSEGKVIQAFGIPMEFKWDNAILNGGNLFVDDNGDIVVFFHFFPVMRRYSKTGELVAEHHMETEIFNIKEKSNKNINSNRLQGMASYAPVALSAGKMNDHYFLADYLPPRIWIREIDEKGNIVKTFWIRDGFWPRGIIPKMENNQLVFYILESSPEAKINIFASKNK